MLYNIAMNRFLQAGAQCAIIKGIYDQSIGLKMIGYDHINNFSRKSNHKTWKPAPNPPSFWGEENPGVGLFSA